MTPDTIIVQVNKPIDHAVFQYLLQFSPPEKRQYILRQRVKQNADTMAVGGALARYMLWRAFHIPPDVHIAYGEFGKLYLPDYPHAHFNISHSGEYVACAVCDAPIGIDIQKVVAYRPATADRICTPEELKQIEYSKDKGAEFTRIWARKEARAKTTGMGIAHGFIPYSATIQEVFIKVIDSTAVCALCRQEI